ncbi:fascin domain-containing protein [Streptomyces sp. NPDC088757]|uniref:fascin domain-containing protein n=1 Tax=Streptomyces sp. NPDC088757 TaxID=3365889 RepID=UPI00380D7AC6
MPVTSSDKYALRSVGAGGLYVSVEIETAGSGQAVLRARKAAPTPEGLGSWEKFTLHTDDKGCSTTLRSEANGNYVTTERSHTGSHQNLLRARGATAGGLDGDLPAVVDALVVVGDGRGAPVERCPGCPGGPRRDRR